MTLILGLGILIIPAIIWFALKCRVDNLASREEEGRAAGV
jgi:hypothetical protein